MKFSIYTLNFMLNHQQLQQLQRQQLQRQPLIEFVIFYDEDISLPSRIACKPPA